MNLITYVGGCSTLCEHGQMFTKLKRSCVLNDKDSIPFINNSEYRVTKLEDEDILENNPNDEDNSDEQRKKLSKLTVDQLTEMCTLKGFSIDGKKNDLIDRLLTSKE